MGIACAVAVPLLAAMTLAANRDLFLLDELAAFAPFFAAAVLSWLWLAYRVRNADLGLYAIAVCLMGIGLVMIGRLDPELFAKQRVWTVVSLGACVLVASCLRRPPRLESYTYLCGSAAASLLVLTMLIGKEINGARLWLGIGALTIQPSEFSKLLMCIFLAGYLGQRREVLSDWTERAFGIPYPSIRHLGPLVVMWAASVCLLIFQRDLGCALVFFCVFLAMLYVATSRTVFVVLGLALFALAAYLCAPLFPHLATRVTAWLDPWPHIDTAGHQITQSLFALASGDIIGAGIGRGLPQNIPVAESDFIFAAICEELGYVGGAAICLVFALFVARAVRHAMVSRDDFSSLLCAGLAASFGLQAAIIIAGVTKAMPMTGITLPFVSYGGSSLAASGVALGLLLRLSARANEHISEGKPYMEAPRAAPLAKFHIALFVLLTAWLGYWQIVRAQELAFHEKNPRLIAMERQIERGNILDRRGQALAVNGDVLGERLYPAGPAMSHAIGYRDDVFGLAGMEGACSGWLLGLRQREGGITEVLGLRDRRTRGFDVQLTIDLGLQRRAFECLGNHKGAVVALDPSSGEILALVSKPSFDPRRIGEEMGQTSEGNSRLLNRATQGLYPPGSAFKIFVAAAALDSGTITEQFQASCAGEEIIANDRIRCWKKGGHGILSLEQAIAQSCNICFAKVGQKLGPELFEKYAEQFGIGTTPRIGLPVSRSTVPTGAQLNEPMLLESSFGQGAVQVTALQMALIGATIANHGIMMEPYLIRASLDGDAVVEQTQGHKWRAPISADTASRVSRFMRTAATSGTARAGTVSGYVTAGKTGTAENPHGRPHAWFVGFAPFEAPQVVVAIVVENGGSGGAVAAPIGRQVMQYWLKRLSEA